MKFLIKFSNKLLNTKGQALLLIMIVAMISLAIVLGVFERTNRQLNIQRQNSEYKLAFDKVLGAVDAMQALINSGKVVDPYDSQLINNSLKDSNIIPCTDPSATQSSSGSSSCEYKIEVDRYDPTKPTPYAMNSDSSIFVRPFNKNSVQTVASFKVWCDLTPTNSAVLVQPIYQVVNQNGGGNGPNPGNGVGNTNTYNNSDTIAIDCTKTNAYQTDPNKNTDINGGPDWVIKNTLPSNPQYISSTGETQADQYGVIAESTDSLSDPLNSGSYRSYQNLLFFVPSSKQKLVGIRVIPKTGYAFSQNIQTSIVVELYDNFQKLIGTSSPLTGIASGYAKSGTTSTIRFTIQNNLRMPNFFNYVAFEGQ